MDLTGTWRATPTDDEVRRRLTEPELDLDAWEPIAVPAHWRLTPAFASHDGPLMYARRFEVPPIEAGQRQWLVFDGVFYQADVWLDGHYLGDTEGYFVPHQFELEPAADGRSERCVAVEVNCAPVGDPRAKRNLTGAFQRGDAIDPDWNPGGIWRPVTVVTSGPVRVTSSRVLCREVDASRAVISITAELDADEHRTATLRTTVGDLVDTTAEQPLAKGPNRVSWTVTVDHPPLWWPWALGDPHLLDVGVLVTVDGEVSDRFTRKVGLRQVTLRDWVWWVNGERLFAKGINLGPTRLDLATARPEDVTRDVALAKDAGLDLLRVRGHIARPELYDAADAAGMLVWQDLPLDHGYARSVRRQAGRQARAAVDLLGHHASIGLWCGHQEPFRVNAGDLPAAGAKAVRSRVAYLAQQQLPTWNKSVLDRSVKRAIEKADGTRPVIAHSGVLPHLPLLDGTDAHLWFGWRHGSERDLPGFARAMPRQVRFVSEFGAQAVPADAEFMEPQRWPDLDWDRLSARHGLQRSRMERHVAAAMHDTFEQWQHATQRYQATVVKHHVEALRRLKYRPTGGFCVMYLADAQPLVSFALLGHDRSAKEAYHALAEACRPVIVVADRLPASLAAGEAIALDVHVVSDLHLALEEAVVTATLRWPGGQHSWRWAGTVPADEVIRIGTVTFVAPAEPGPVTLDLDLVYGDVAATNRYTSAIAPAH